MAVTRRSPVWLKRAAFSAVKAAGRSRAAATHAGLARPGHSLEPDLPGEATSQVRQAVGERGRGMAGKGRCSAKGCRVAQSSDWERSPHRPSPWRQTLPAWRPHVSPSVAIVRPHRRRGGAWSPQRKCGQASLAEDRIAVRKTSPRVLLARFRRDARLEIGELRREERASLRARRAVIDWRRIGLCVHRVESPQSRAGKRDYANRGPSGRRGQERHDKLRFRHRCPPGLVARCCPRMSLLLQSTTKRASDRGLKYSVTNSSCPAR